jgi:hypothetical protein
MTMAIEKTILALAVLLVPLFMAAPTAGATEQEEGQVLAVLESVADEWNKTQVTSASHCEAALTIVDNTPPYLFQGAEAVQNWLRAYRDNELGAAATKANTSLRFLEPTVVIIEHRASKDGQTVEIEGVRAYIAVPAEWTATLDGRSDVSHGVVTATLDRSSHGWLIAAWTWTRAVADNVKPKPRERFRAKHAPGRDPGVDTGSREETASKQESGASVLIQSEPKLL